MKLFVSFEGVEATGKSTLISQLAGLLRDCGISYSLKPEFPVRSVFFDRIQDALERSIFVSEGFEEGSLAAFFFMLYAEALNLLHADYDSDVLLADRYIDSIAIYQGYFACADREDFGVVSFLGQLEALFTRLDVPIPDLTFFLRSSLKVISNQFGRREHRSLTAEELKQIATFQSFYEQIAQTRSRFYVLESTNDVESIATEALKVIIKKLR